MASDFVAVRPGDIISSDLINDLLSLNAIASGQVRMNPRLEDPRLLLQECAAIGVMLATRKKIHLILEAPDELPMVVCDRERLAQALNKVLQSLGSRKASGTSVAVSAPIIDGGETLAFQAITFLVVEQPLV